MTGELTDALEQFLYSKGKGPEGKSGHYRRNADREVSKFIEWLTERGVDSFAKIDDQGHIPFRRYARELARRDVRQQTIQTYWNYISAWTGWCARDGFLETNYAQQSAAKEPLPASEGRREREQQTWSTEQRKAVTRYIDEQATDAIDRDGHDAVQAVRDRALVFVLAYTGIRGGEFLRDTEDTRRNGLRWTDVDLEREQVEVLSKKQKLDERPLTPLVVPKIKRLRTVLDPPTAQWPVFPTLSLAKLYADARAGLREAGMDEERISETLDAASGAAGVLAVYRNHDLVPQSMTTGGARERMRTITDDAAVSFESDRHDYLAPHGGRRGVGRVLVETRSVETAAEQLDNSVEVVEEHYSDVLAEKQSEDVGDAFNEYDE